MAKDEVEGEERGGREREMERGRERWREDMVAGE